MGSSPSLVSTAKPYFSPAKITRAYVLGLALLAACVLTSFAIIQISLSFQQRQVRISALAAEQSRLFSDIGVYSRSLMRATVADNAPEASIDALRFKMRDAGERIRANMEELLRLDNAPVAGLVRIQVISKFYREAPHDLEAKINRYLARINELSSLNSQQLAVRFNQWVPMDIAVATGSLMQSSFDDAMAEAYSASHESVALMERAEWSITMVILLILVFEGIYLFAPLVQVLQRQAREDRLTGLANRTLFYETLSKQLTSAAARGGKSVLIVFDMDRFKPINDTLGHMAGDALLQEVAKRTANLVGKGGLVARLGGDEFAILAPPNFDLDTLPAFLRQIADVIEQPMMHEQWEMQPAASLGAAIFPEHGETPERLFAAADAALCAAKKQRSVFLVYDNAMRAADDAERELMLELKRAVAEYELCVYYQPQVAMRTNVCIGFEALLRWNHPTKGLLTAGQFVHLADGLGLVPQITAQVVSIVARDIRRWLDQGVDPGVIGINMPEEMFATDIAQQMIEAALSDNAVPYDRICIEVTEDVFLNRAAEQISERLAAMRTLGIRIAFDDFGTGYASLSHLKRFPFDELKIDKSFVDDLTRDAKSAEIIRALIGLARNLGKSVVAEGIETEEQRALLLAEGCPVGQGYLFAKAVPFEEATVFANRPQQQPSAKAADIIQIAVKDGVRGRTAGQA